MILLWMLCVGLVLGGLLASLANQVPWGNLRFERMRCVPVLVQAPCAAVRLLERTRVLSSPYVSSRAGPPGSALAWGERRAHFG